jgi:hypothetical protein
MRIYGEITKMEPQPDGTIKVIGVASTGAIDDADETVLPEAMKAALPAYMRFGALREMHGLNAAGATLSAQVGDDGATRIETHVVDPVAVKKVKHGHRARVRRGQCGPVRHAPEGPGHGPLRLRA